MFSSVASTKNACVFALALVLAPSVFAAPSPADPGLDHPPAAATEENAKPEPVVTDTIDITPVRPSNGSASRKLEATEYFYAYRNSLSPRLGLFTTNDGNETAFALGILYNVQFRNLRYYEFGADLISNNTGRVHAAKRWLFSRGSFRPYAKAGAGLKIIPKDELTTFLKLENFQAVGSVGFEQLVQAPYSLRLDLSLMASTEDIEGLATVGYSWAW